VDSVRSLDGPPGSAGSVTNRTEPRKPPVPFTFRWEDLAVNTFDGRLAHPLEDVRWALAVEESTPVISFDARDRRSVRDALLDVLDRALVRAAQAPAGSPR
jgi:hypothetical protein